VQIVDGLSDDFALEILPMQSRALTAGFPSAAWALRAATGCSIASPPSKAALQVLPMAPGPTSPGHTFILEFRHLAAPAYSRAENAGRASVPAHARNAARA